MGAMAAMSVETTPSAYVSRMLLNCVPTQVNMRLLRLLDCAKGQVLGAHALAAQVRTLALHPPTGRLYDPQPRALLCAVGRRAACAWTRIDFCALAKPI